MPNYIERTNIKSVSATTSQKDMVINLKNMINNVTNMLNNEGPIYTTWIKFQLGADSDPLIFDSSSTNPQKNLIAQLEYNKSGAGVTNDFTLLIQYDPYNMGQQTQNDTIEKLDEYVAKVISATVGNDSMALTGYIQYGYNAVSDASLVSPRYEFIITSATTEIKYESGLSTYTFKGTSTIGADCDNVTNFPARDDANILQVVEETLYYWYGTEEHPAPHVTGIKPIENDYKYKIVIEDDLYNDSLDGQTIPAKSGATPWQYCEAIFSQFCLTKSESESKLYADVESLSAALRPRFTMYVNDSDRTLHVTHIVPKVNKDENGYITGVDYSEKGLLSLDYTFSWGYDKQNLVVGWKPEVDTYVYLIRSARKKRLQNQLDTAKMSNDVNAEETIKELESQLGDINDDLNELFDAQLQTIGIPADVPMGVEVGVEPHILETVSRLAGIYVIVSASDTISSTGIFSTTFKLYRIRGFDDKVVALTPSSSPDASETTNTTNNAGKVTVNAQAQNDNKVYQRPITKPDWSDLDIKLVQ